MALCSGLWCWPDERQYPWRVAKISQSSSKWGVCNENWDKAYCQSDVYLLAQAAMKLRDIVLAEAAVGPYDYMTIVSVCMANFRQNLFPAWRTRHTAGVGWWLDRGLQVERCLPSLRHRWRGETLLNQVYVVSHYPCSCPNVCCWHSFKELHTVVRMSAAL